MSENLRSENKELKEKLRFEKDACIEAHSVIAGLKYRLLDFEDLAKDIIDRSELVEVPTGHKVLIDYGDFRRLSELVDKLKKE